MVEVLKWERGFGLGSMGSKLGLRREASADDTCLIWWKARVLGAGGASQGRLGWASASVRTVSV